MGEAIACPIPTDWFRRSATLSCSPALTCLAAKRTLEREYAEPDTYSSRADPPRANPVGLAATGNYGEVPPQYGLAQADCSKRPAPDQSRLHDRGVGAVAAAG